MSSVMTNQIAGPWDLEEGQVLWGEVAFVDQWAVNDSPPGNLWETDVPEESMIQIAPLDRRYAAWSYGERSQFSRIVDANATVYISFTRGDTDRARQLERRLARANSYFSRKAAEVFVDDNALQLLDNLYDDIVVNQSDFDVSGMALALAKLTAAGFVEIGANVVYITEAGQRYVLSIEERWKTLKAAHPETP